MKEFTPLSYNADDENINRENIIVVQISFWKENCS